MGLLTDAEAENPAFGVPAVENDDEQDENGKPTPGGRKGNTAAKRAKAIAANVVFGNPADQLLSRHEASVAQQKQSLDDMSRKTEDALDKENYSRVAQAREEADRQHELQMEMIRQQGALDRLNAIKAQHDAQSQLPSQEGGGLRWWNPNTMQWEYGSKFTIGPNGPSLT